MGTLNLTTPWSRRYFDEAHRADVEALIPDGHVLSVGASRKPGEWTLVLTPPRTPEEVAGRRHAPELHRVTVYAKDLAWACAEMLRRWNVMTVTVDLDGTPTLHGWERG